MNGADEPAARGDARTPVQAVALDLDGVLIDSETIWDDARRHLAAAYGAAWPPDATRAMMGMSSLEWSVYLRDVVGVPLSAERISSEVATAVRERYAQGLPFLPGARDAVLRLARRWPLGLASSSNRTIIEQFLDSSDLRECFAATVSSEEVERGKPAPDVYLAAVNLLQVSARRCVAIEDSTNGIRAAAAADLTVVAVPNAHFPPAGEDLALAALVVPDLAALTFDAIERAASISGNHPFERRES